LCGIGVTSRIVVTVRPTAWSARSADSRPEPGPLTSTSSVRMPCSIAFLPASSAATCAAYGVDLREPLKPSDPALDQEIVFPCPSLIVMMVLLKVAATWATPTATFFFSFLRARGAGFAIVSFLLRHFLLAGDRLGRTFAGACIGMRALAPDRKAFPMPEAPVAAEVHQPLDIHRHFAAEVAFDKVVPIDRLADLDHLGIGQVVDPAVFGDPHLFADFPGLGGADAMDVAKPDLDALLRGNVGAGDARHG